MTQWDPYFPELGNAPRVALARALPNRLGTRRIPDELVVVARSVKRLVLEPRGPVG
jgi:hypothetical protein